MTFDQSQNLPDKYVFTVNYDDITVSENIKIVISSKVNCNQAIDETTITNVSNSPEFSDELKKTIDLEIEDTKERIITDVPDTIAEVEYKVSSKDGIKKLDTSNRDKLTDDIKNYFSTKLGTATSCITVDLPNQDISADPTQDINISKNMGKIKY